MREFIDKKEAAPRTRKRHVMWCFLPFFWTCWSPPQAENRCHWVRSGVTPANQTKERPVHEFFPGWFRNKSSICESRLFSQGKTPEFTEMGEIHELFVLALSLVWFAGATPDSRRWNWTGMPMILGVNLGREFFEGGLKPWKNKTEKLVKIRRAKIKKSPEIRSAEPQAQDMFLAAKDRITWWMLLADTFNEQAEGAFYLNKPLAGTLQPPDQGQATSPSQIVREVNRCKPLGVHLLTYLHRTSRFRCREHLLPVHASIRHSLPQSSIPWCFYFRWLGVSETGSAKTGSAIDVRIDDAGLRLKFRIGFSLWFSAVASQLRPSLVVGFGGIRTVDTEFPYRAPIVDALRAQRLKKFKIALRDWKFQSRLKFSSEPPTKPLFFLWEILKVRDWKFQAKLKFSIEIEIFNRDWFFSIFGPRGIKMPLRALWVGGRLRYPCLPTPFPILRLVFSTPNMTGRGFHRTTEVIPHRPWKPLASRPLKISKNTGPQGVHARYDAALPPIISIVVPRSSSHIGPRYFLTEIFLHMGKEGPICHIARALPASIWGHCSQILVFTSIWDPHWKGCVDDLFRAVFPSIWVSWNRQTLQKKGKRRMTTWPVFLPPPPPPRKFLGVLSVFGSLSLSF